MPFDKCHLSVSIRTDNWQIMIHSLTKLCEIWLISWMHSTATILCWESSACLQLYIYCLATRSVLIWWDKELFAWFWSWCKFVFQNRCCLLQNYGKEQQYLTETQGFCGGADGRERCHRVSRHWRSTWWQVEEERLWQSEFSCLVLTLSAATGAGIAQLVVLGLAAKVSRVRYSSGDIFR